MDHPRPNHPHGRPPIDRSGALNVYVECTRGSDVKDKFDPRTRALSFHKHMPRGLPWPFAYGFVCGTRAEDGDPVDAVVLSTRDVGAGAVIPCRVLGTIEAEQTVAGETHRNDRVIAADAACPRYGAWTSLDDASDDTVRAIEEFFIAYNEAQGRSFRVLGRVGPVDSLRRLAAGG